MAKEKLGFHNKPTQESRILAVLESAKLFNTNDGWVSGLHFQNELFIMQYHARIFGLQKKGYIIKGEFRGDDIVKSYKLFN